MSDDERDCEVPPRGVEGEQPRSRLVRFWRRSFTERLRENAGLLNCFETFIGLLQDVLRVVLLIMPFFAAMLLDVLTIWNFLLASRLFVWILKGEEIPPKKVLMRQPRGDPENEITADGEKADTREYGELAHLNIWSGDVILNIVYTVLVIAVLAVMFVALPVLVMLDVLTCHFCKVATKGSSAAVSFTINLAKWLNYWSNDVQRRFLIASVATACFPQLNRPTEDILESMEDGLEVVIERLMAIEMFFARVFILGPAMIVAAFVDIVTLWSGLFTNRIFVMIILGEEFPSVDDFVKGKYKRCNIWDGTVILNVFFLIVFDLALLLSIVLVIVILIVDTLTLSKFKMSAKLKKELPEALLLVQQFFDRVSHGRKKYLVAWILDKEQKNTCLQVLFVLLLLVINAIAVVGTTEAAGVSFLFAAPPTPNPTGAPTLSPVPTPNPSSSPTLGPTANPTNAPTLSPVPTPNPSSSPSVSPSSSPTSMPTQSPVPTVPTAPSVSPTAAPSHSPTPLPTGLPSVSPTPLPTGSPSLSPTLEPTFSPTSSPTARPTSAPTLSPTLFPTRSPTISPTLTPTTQPTSSPTDSPTGFPTDAPTGYPTSFPTSNPTFRELTNSELKAVMASRLELTLGWRDLCQTCTDGPVKFAQVFDSACSVSDSSSFCVNDNGRTYGAVNIDGTADEEDRIYLDLKASSLNCGFPFNFQCRSGNPTQKAIYALGFLCVAIGWRDVCSGCSDPPLRFSQWCVDPGLGTTVSGTNSLPGSINTGGAVNDDDQFYVSAYVHPTASPTLPLLTYAKSNCFISFGTRDACNGCSSPPTKRGSVGFDGSCFDVVGSDSLCAGSYVSINTDGVVNDDDMFYIALTCN